MGRNKSGRHINKHNGKTMLSIPITLLITIISFLIPCAVAYGVLTQKVDDIKEDIDYSKTIDLDKIKDIEVRVVGLERNDAGQEVSSQELKEDVYELKQDFKELEEKVDDVNKNVILILDKVSNMGVE